MAAMYRSIGSQNLWHRCTTDVPNWLCRYLITLKIYNERQEISCRRVDRLVSLSWLSPTWLSPRWLVAEMTAHQWRHTVATTYTPTFPGKMRRWILEQTYYESAKILLKAVDARQCYNKNMRTSNLFGIALCTRTWIATVRCRQACVYLCGRWSFIAATFYSVVKPFDDFWSQSLSWWRRVLKMKRQIEGYEINGSVLWRQSVPVLSDVICDVSGFDLVRLGAVWEITRSHLRGAIQRHCVSHACNRRRRMMTIDCQ